MGSHIFTGLGIVLAGAVLTGALLVGDSVRGTLEARGLSRIAEADAVLATREREFRADLAEELAGHLVDVQLAPAWRMIGQGRSESAGLGGVQVVGCDARMGAMAHKPWPQPDPGEAFVSESLAQELGLKEGLRILNGRVRLDIVRRADDVAAAWRQGVNPLPHFLARIGRCAEGECPLDGDSTVEGELIAEVGLQLGWGHVGRLRLQ